MDKDYIYLEEMYRESYFPNHLVDKVKEEILKVVAFIEEGKHSNDEIQEKLDIMTDAINDLQEAFEDADSEIETVARDSIGTTVMDILEHYKIDIDGEEAIRNRDW